MTDQPTTVAACTRADFHGAMSMRCQECGYQPWPNDWYDGSLAAFEPKPLAETDPGV